MIDRLTGVKTTGTPSKKSPNPCPGLVFYEETTPPSGTGEMGRVKSEKCHGLRLSDGHWGGIVGRAPPGTVRGTGYRTSGNGVRPRNWRT
jgi:hypothetical protein